MNGFLRLLAGCLVQLTRRIVSNDEESMDCSEWHAVPTDEY